MRTLSKTWNGKVVKTSSVGFSVKRNFTKICKFLDANKIEYTIEHAKSGTSYIDAWVGKNEVNFDMRISNHTKRGQELFNAFDLPTVKTYTNIKKETLESCHANLLTNDQVNEVIELIKKYI